MKETHEYRYVEHEKVSLKLEGEIYKSQSGAFYSQLSQLLRKFDVTGQFNDGSTL